MGVEQRLPDERQVAMPHRLRLSQAAQTSQGLRMTIQEIQLNMISFFFWFVCTFAGFGFGFAQSWGLGFDVGAV